MSLESAEGSLSSLHKPVPMQGGIGFSVVLKSPQSSN